MAAIEEYFESWGRELKESFSRIQQTVLSTHVKGGTNEDIVAKFLEKHFPTHKVLTNVEIIDADGRRSREIDVVVCNSHQPFAGAESKIVLVEGVSFVVEVKARLTKEEIERIIENCRSVKELAPRFSQQDMARSRLTAREDTEYYAKHVPYFVFAFGSRLKTESAVKSMESMAERVPAEYQPDALFVNGKYTVFNQRSGQMFGYSFDGRRPVGFVGLKTEGKTVTEFIQLALALPPLIDRVGSPLMNYLPREPYRGCAVSVDEEKS